MKKHFYHITGLVAGSLLMVACGSYNSAYVDDIYYNPKYEAKQAAKEEAKRAELKSAAIIDTTQTDSSDFFYSDYDDYKYADRLKKFHDDEYEGEYFEEEAQSQWNTSVNFGFSPYGTSWSVGFGYGYGGYNPWMYDPWYYPYYSYWDPWYTPYYGWGYPYYYSHHYYRHYYHPHYCWWGSPGYPEHPIYPGYPSSSRNYHYGKRNSVASGSPIRTNNGETGNTRKTDYKDKRFTRSETGFDKLDEDLAPIAYTPATRKKISTTDKEQNKSFGEVKRIESNTKNSATTNAGNSTIEKVSATRTKKTFVNSYEKPPAVSRSAVMKKELKVPAYTRTRTEAKKVTQSNTSRNGYTPSYTRTRSNTTRTNYNSGSNYSSTTRSSTVKRTATPTRSTSVGTKSRSYNTTSRSTAVKRSTTQTNTKQSYPSQSRSTSTYKRPSSSSGSSSKSYSSPSRSSYSSPSKSSYSSPSRSSSSSGSKSSGSATRRK